MSVRARLVLAAFALVAVAGISHGTTTSVSAQQAQQAAPAGPVFEVRTYIASAGKFEDLQARFRDHTIRIFARHGMKSIAYWIPTDQRNTLVYIIQHESREAAARNWKAFMSDPEWMKVAAASNASGNLVARVDTYFATAADYSPVK
ncbi:MAG: NIPSNAP family protein [Acidobacteria bacterium]|nr:NIPSNAP family protein [Acidobacteriota bacterium]